MKKLSEKCEAVFAAVAFAEQAEWDEAVRFAEGTPKMDVADKRQMKEAERKQYVDKRPRLLL